MLRCVGCKYNNDCTKVIRVEMENCTEYYPLTNADHIRSMTDEELAKKISGIEQFALTTDGAWSPEQWLDWLKQEAE